MLNGLDLFSGIAGISLALEPWVKTIAYCECDKYAQSVLLSRMADGRIDPAPIWDDVKTLDGTQLKGLVDIIFGGFPCQDISCAGAGKGMEGERSWLFTEIMRLAEEARPKFIFLENVPAIRTRGLAAVVRELARLRYDARWGCISAYDVGAPHKRERWFCLAHSQGKRIGGKVGNIRQAHGGSRKSLLREFVGASEDDSNPNGQRFSEYEKCDYKGSKVSGTLRDNFDRLYNDVAHHPGIGCLPRRPESKGQQWISCTSSGSSFMADSYSAVLQGRCECGQCSPEWTSWACGGAFPGAWESDAGILRVAHGVQKRVDRIRCLGNAVVPIQAREAFKRLMFG